MNITRQSYKKGEKRNLRYKLAILEEVKKILRQRFYCKALSIKSQKEYRIQGKNADSCIYSDMTISSPWHLGLIHTNHKDILTKLF